MTARSLMVQGTASSVGKTIVTAALCRLFRQEGLRVAPFKSQNMALNAYVTPDGKEIGRAQAVQAAAAGVTPSVDMNPILIKPEGSERAQLVVLGEVVASLGSDSYERQKPDLRRVVKESLERLRAEYDLVLIEGAGSPAEINLKERDIANMFVAELADAPVLLVADIDRGGVFAAIVGTLELLEPHERARVAGLLINKFRGNLGLLQPGLELMQARTGVPVLGVLPYLARLRIADEDSVGLEERAPARRAGRHEVEIAVVRLPRISNTDDFLPLEHEPNVVVRFVDQPSELAGTDLVVLPGSKSTLSDLAFLREQGFARALIERAASGAPILGICGGCQMLGTALYDPERVESERAYAAGLGLLAFETEFGRDKLTAQVAFDGNVASFLCDDSSRGLGAYEIHSGRLRPLDATSSPFRIRTRNGSGCDALDGQVSPNGAIVGTLLHGLFENIAVRRTLLAYLFARRTLPAPIPNPAPPVDEFDRLAQTLRKHVDLKALFALVGR